MECIPWVYLFFLAHSLESWEALQAWVMIGVRAETAVLVLSIINTFSLLSLFPPHFVSLCRD